MMLGVVAGQVRDGWLGTWAHRRSITIDSTKVDAALADYPVLLRLSSSSGTGSTDLTEIFDELGDNKLKLAVTLADGTTECYVEVAEWDSVGELAALWVKVPTVAADADTVLYVYYGAAHPDNTSRVGVAGTTVAQHVWDDDYVMVVHGGDAEEPLSSGVTTRTFAGAYDVKPFMLGGNRYIACREGTYAPLKIYSADASWNAVALITTASLPTKDVSGVCVYPVLGNKVVFWGNGSGNAFIEWYDFDTDTWSSTLIAECDYLGRVIYRPEDELFYISTSLTTPADPYYNTLQTATAANLLTPANWTAVALPAWSGTNVEVFHAISGDYLYLQRYDSYYFRWDLYRWDFDETWTLIEANLDGAAGLLSDMIPLLAANDQLIVVPEAYRTPYPQWRIRTSTDGTTWQTAYTLPMLVSTAGGHENVAEVFLDGARFLVSISQTTTADGYFVLSDQSGNHRVFPGPSSHYGESSIGDMWKDGSSFVLGGQDLVAGQTQLNVLDSTVALTNDGRVPASPHAVRDAKTGIGWPKRTVEGDGLVKAQVFNGSSDYITLSRTDFESGPMTAEIVHRPSSVTGTQMVVHQSNQYLYTGWYMALSANQVECGLWNASSAAIRDRKASATLSIGTDYYSAFTWNPADELRIYLDGEEGAYAASSGAGGAVAYYYDFPVRMGAHSSGGSLFTGQQEEVRVSRIVRSAAYLKANQSNFRDALVAYGTVE